MKRAFTFIFRMMGLALAVFGLYIGTVEDKTAVAGAILHVNSAVLVVCILAGISFLSYTPGLILGTLKSLITISPSNLESTSHLLIKALPEITEGFYRSGPLGIQQALSTLKAPRVWQGIFEQLENKVQFGDIQNSIRSEAQSFEFELNRQISVLSALAAVCPSVGLLGSVLGLVKMMANMQDLASIGPNMALALLTALYGIFLSVVIFTPLSARLEAIRDSVSKDYELAGYWVHLIENQKPAMFVKSRRAA